MVRESGEDHVKLDEYIAALNEIRSEHGGNLELYVESPCSGTDLISAEKVRSQPKVKYLVKRSPDRFQKIWDSKLDGRKGKKVVRLAGT